jgi:hypothetical protein
MSVLSEEDSIGSNGKWLWIFKIVEFNHSFLRVEMPGDFFAQVKEMENIGQGRWI